MSTERFDGVYVDKYLARFINTVELDPTEALGLDSTAMAVVTFRVKGANFDETANGELVRVNKFKVDQFAVVNDDELREAIYDALPKLEEPEATLPFPKTPPTDGPRVVAAPKTQVEHVADEPSVSEEEVFSPGAPRRVGPPATSSDAMLRRFIETGN